MSHALSEIPPGLLEVQRAFHAPNSSLLPWIVENSINAEQRLGIYRNNTASNLCNALRADYPVVDKLVGDEFFFHMANTYIADNRSLSGDINDYGDGFPEFIVGFLAAAGLPYLADVARLELAWKESFYSADAKAADFVALAELPSERFGDLRFQLHPALRLVSSRYPILQIWNANQNDTNSAVNIDLNAGAEWVLVRRAGEHVEMSLLARAEFNWLVALSAGRSLTEAVDAAFAVTKSFDVSDGLRCHISQASFVAYFLEGC